MIATQVRSSRTTWQRPSTALALCGLAVALGVRVAVGGAALATSIPAAALFALACCGVAYWTRTRALSLPRTSHVGWGVIGAVLLIAPTLFGHAVMPWRVTASPLWFVVTSTVALGEELLLRGSIFSVLQRSSTTLAWAATTVLFALIHVPLYGIGVLPLDLSVGALLGVLRIASGSATAPAIAHVCADIAAGFSL